MVLSYKPYTEMWEAVELGGGRYAKEMSCGADSFCVLLDNKQVKCWGSNAYGQLGQGHSGNRQGGNMPEVRLGASRGVEMVSVGTQFSCAVLDDGSVKCWGRNNFGQLGLGDASNRGDSPGEMGDELPSVALGEGRAAVSVDVGQDHACALLEDGSVKCWGRNWRGQLGLGHTRSRGHKDLQLGDALPAVQFGGGHWAVSISAGQEHTCAVLNDGHVKCFGWNEYGQLGLGDISPRGGGEGEMGEALPVVDLGKEGRAVRVSAGSDHTCALLRDGSVKCWGGNLGGQLGLGDRELRGDGEGEMGEHLPAVQLQGRAGVHRRAEDIRCRAGYSCALLADGEMRCWGRLRAGEGSLFTALAAVPQPEQSLLEPLLLACDAGYHGGACAPCPTGTFKPEDAMHCSACSKPHHTSFLFTSALTSDACLFDCAPGSYRPPGLTSASSEEFSDMFLACEVCPEGYRCPGAEHPPTTCEAAPGSYCPAGHASEEGAACPEGSFCPGGHQPPHKCTVCHGSDHETHTCSNTTDTVCTQPTVLPSSPKSQADIALWEGLVIGAAAIIAGLVGTIAAVWYLHRKRKEQKKNKYVKDIITAVSAFFGQAKVGDEAKFVARFLVLGAADEAAAGLRLYLGLTDDNELGRKLALGVEEVEREWAEGGDEEDQDNLRYVLYGSGRHPDSIPRHVQRQMELGEYHGGPFRPEDFDFEHDGMTLHDFVEHENSQLAGLSAVEVLALRLYTTSSYGKFNRSLREHVRPHPFAMSVYHLSEGLKKLRAVAAKMCPEEFSREFTLWRGMKDLQLDTDNFVQFGGTELACMSTTASLEVAAKYADNTRPLLFQYKTKGLSRGVNIQYLSVFPLEQEYLYPPLTFLQPEGQCVTVDRATVIPVVPQIS